MRKGKRSLFLKGAADEGEEPMLAGVWFFTLVFGNDLPSAG